MRLKNVEINTQSGKIELNNLPYEKAFIIICSHERARYTELPNYGEVSVITYQGKVKRVKFDEGEEF